MGPVGYSLDLTLERNGRRADAPFGTPAMTFHISDDGAQKPQTVKQNSTMDDMPPGSDCYALAGSCFLEEEVMTLTGALTCMR